MGSTPPLGCALFAGRSILWGRCSKLTLLYL